MELRLAEDRSIKAAGSIVDAISEKKVLKQKTNFNWQ